MEKRIFSGHGITIVERDGKFYVLYDTGEIVLKYQEAEITKEECIKAQKSEKDAYEILLSVQSKKKTIS